jgi:peptidoglycan/xylan/chitin deacetylase (PgdA/CDA1 family)
VAAAVSCAVVLGASPLTTVSAGSPASRPVPVVLDAAVVRCPAAPYGPRVYAPGGAGKTVALTFDDGPGASTAAILALLDRNRIPATFPNLGENMTVRPQLVRQEARHGYVLGNHTWNHPIMTRLSVPAQAAEMDRVIAEQRYLTRTVPCVFRPPYGIYDATTLHLARQRRMSVWLWSVDTQDWMARGSGSSYWVRRIIRLAESEGGRLRHPVVLMHNQPAGNPATVSALPSIIRFFRSHGYRFVAL